MARRTRRAPLPLRDGLDPTRLRLVAQDDQTIADVLTARFPDDAARLLQKLEAGEVVDELGRPLGAETPARTGSHVWLYRDPPIDEPTVPFDVEVIDEDEDLLVVDKPHFLATTPRGVNVRESVLVRLRRQTGFEELAPAHRLDRATAGVLVLVKRAARRGAYQTLFQRREVHKIYEAVAPWRGDLELPRVVRSRIVKERGVMAAREVAGEPNAETCITLSRRLGAGGADAPGASGEPARGLYRLEPRTGKTHQLRVHMAALGIPILGDDFFPELRERARDDFRNPLQLLARSVSLVDPRTGEHRTFVSRRVLDHAR